MGATPEEEPMAEMDEQDPRPTETSGDPHEEHLARYGAPVPPPVPSFGPPVAPPASVRRRGPRFFAAGTALTVVAAAAGVGFALGRFDHHTQPSAGGPPAGYAGRAPHGREFRGTPFTGPGGSGGTPFDSASSGTPASDSELTGLVRIASTLKYQGGRAAGTGMILTSTGEVVTNHHVVEGSTRLRVTVMSTGSTYRATVVGTDARDDIAVLQL
jgi:S1-C subfamily serine protease